MTAQRTITVIPDTAAKRREYEEEVVRTFYLSNADLKETIDLLRIVVDARRIAPLTGTNALTIKDTPQRVAATGRIIQAIDKARPEVVIDVELLEVNRTRLLEYGLQFASPTAAPTGIDGVADVNRDNLTLQNLLNLSQSDIILTNLPTLYYRLLKSDNNSRTLANPQLRTSEGVTAQARFGEQIPVPVTTFSPIATGGVAQQPITSFQYQNIGVNIDITPRTHHDDDVSLVLKVVVNSLSGTGFGGLPTFGNREITTSIRLRDGETNLLAGLIRDDERTVMDGIPGLSDLPIVGRLFAHNKKSTEQTDIVLTHYTAHHPGARSQCGRPEALPGEQRRERAAHRPADHHAADTASDGAGRASATPRACATAATGAADSRNTRAHAHAGSIEGVAGPYSTFATIAPSAFRRSTR